jgi:hypothetical protein
MNGRDGYATPEPQQRFVKLGRSLSSVITVSGFEVSRLHHMNPVETSPATQNETATNENPSNGVSASVPAKARKSRKPATVSAPATDGNSAPVLTSGSNLTPMQEAQASLKKLNDENKRLQTVLKTTQKQLATVQNSATDELKLPVTDAQLRKAMDALILATRTNPAKPARSLKSQFVDRDGAATFIGDTAETDDDTHVTPLLTDPQKKDWKKAKETINRLHTVWTREEAPKLISVVKKTLPKASALAFGGYYRRKIKTADGKTVDKVIGARVGAKEAKPVKPDAKPTVQP